jgi:inositol phosphorylceramide mannosyltransferase catalytic subunit
MIPKVIHQIWFQGWEDRPTEGRHFSKSWKDMHRDWQVCHWDHSSLKETFYPLLTNAQKFALHNLPTTIQKVDLWRIIILYHIGGMYVDLDFACLKNMDNYLEGKSFFASSEHDGIIANGLIAAEKFHPFISAAIEYICEDGLTKSVELYPKLDSKAYILLTTGPHAISPIWRQMLNESKAPNAYIEEDENLFFPLRWSGEQSDKPPNNISMEELKSRFRNSYAVHMYWGSWIQ